MFLKLVCFPKLFAGINSLSSFHIFLDFWPRHLFLSALLWCCGMSCDEKYQMNRWMDKHSFSCSAITSKEQFSSVTQSCMILCNPMDCSTPGLRVHHPTLGAYSNSCLLSQWCHPTISSFVVLFSSCLQSFPASGSFQMSQLFSSGGQSIRVSALTSVPPMNTQDLSPLGWTGWISLQSKGLSRVFSNTTVQKHQFFGTQLSL